MSLLDLFTGRWTWLQLFNEIGPLLMACSGAYFAGYWRGRNVELRQRLGERPDSLDGQPVVVSPSQKPCPLCKGTGVKTDDNGIMEDDPCKKCEGTGIEQEGE